MPPIHLLAVDRPADAFAPLIAAARDAGFRVGWLELDRPAVPPPALAAAAARGVLRAVAVDGEGAVVVKPRRGSPVLSDLLREHFQGCRLVLVRGECGAPRLEPEGDGWSVDTGGAARRYATADLVRALGRPRPFGGASD